MTIKSPTDWTHKCISGCIEELKQLTRRCNESKLECLASLCDCEDVRGFFNVIHIYALAFKHKEDRDILAKNDEFLLFKLDDAWTAFLAAIEHRTPDRNLYIALRDAVKNLHDPLRNAYHGHHSEDEEARLQDLKDALTNLSRQFDKMPSAEVKGRIATPKRPRAERKSMVEKREKLITVLKNQAFEMLSLPDKERQKLMDGLTGHSLHVQTKIRESTIGEMIDLKATLTSGKKELDNLLQLLYLVCKNEAVFFFFDEQVKDSTRIWRNKTNDELYHLLKGVLEKTLKQHLRPK